MRSRVKGQDLRVRRGHGLPRVHWALELVQSDQEWEDRLVRDRLLRLRLVELCPRRDQRWVRRCLRDLRVLLHLHGQRQEQRARHRRLDQVWEQAHRRQRLAQG